MFISVLYLLKTQAAVKYRYEQEFIKYEEYTQPVNDIPLKLDESFVVSYEKNEENEGNNRWKVTNFDQKPVKSLSITV